LDCGGEHNIPVLIRDDLHEPLGDPAPNAVKYFATRHVLEIADDVERLGKIRAAIYRHWHGKNSTKSKSTDRTSTNGAKKSEKSAENQKKERN